MIGENLNGLGVTSQQLCEQHNIQTIDWDNAAQNLVAYHELPLVWHAATAHWYPEAMEIPLPDDLADLVPAEHKEAYDAIQVTMPEAIAELQNGVTPSLWSALHPNPTKEQMLARQKDGTHGLASHPRIVDWATHLVKLAKLDGVLRQQAYIQQQRQEANDVAKQYACPVCNEWLYDTTNTLYSAAYPCPQCQWIINARLIVTNDREAKVTKWLRTNKGEVKVSSQNVAINARKAS